MCIYKLKLLLKCNITWNVLPPESPSLARNLNWSGFFSFQETPYTFRSWVVCHPLIKVSTNVCVIAPNFTGCSSSFQQRWLLSKCISLLSRQEVKKKNKKSAATTLSWSFIGLHTFAQLNSIIHQRQQLYEQESVKEEVVMVHTIFKRSWI